VVGHRVRLEVRVYDEVVGELVAGPGGRTQFLPNRDWRLRGQVPRLGWAYYTGQARPTEIGLVPSWFANLLPEAGGLLRRQVCQAHQISENNEPALLSVLGEDLSGAVSIAGSVEDLDEAYFETEESVEAGRFRFSVAGMQPKFSLLQKAGRWVFAGRGDVGSFFFKLGGMLPELPEVELATMRWASEMGLEVPECFVLRDGLDGPGSPFRAGDVAFGIRRFDRGPGACRVHQEDFAQVLDLHPTDKYGGPGRKDWSFDALAGLVRDACGGDGFEDFVRRVGFMVACGNTDAHLKNWSFQWRNGASRPNLSPCYDLVSTISWPDFGWQTGKPAPELALPFAGTQDLSAIDRDRFALFASRCRDPRAQELLEEALVLARESWPRVASGAPERMRAGLGEHWARVPALKSLGGLPGA